MDNKELYHNYSEMEWDQQNCFEKEWDQPREVEYWWMLEVAKVKDELKFNEKVYRKKVIIEKIFGK
jgi:hypothetical protein